MKKIITITLVMILAVTLLAGCGGKTANPTPLSPVYANGVTPDYSSSNIPDDDQADDNDAENPDGTDSESPSTVPEGYTTYADKYVSFNHPESYKEGLALRLRTESGDTITIHEQAVDNANSGFELNVYSELTNENFAEFYTAVVGDTENYDGISVTKATVNGCEVTVVKYFEKVVEEETEAPETTEGEEPEEAPAEPRIGMADIYIENSADEDFKEIIISVSACDYTADTIPEDYTNFSDVVSKLTTSLKIVTAE